MRKSSKFVASALIVGAVFGAGAGAGAALASGATVTTTNRSEVLISPSCFHYHSVTKTYMHWSSAQHRYIPYPNGPRVTTTTYDKCHA